MKVLVVEDSLIRYPFFREIVEATTNLRFRANVNAVENEDILWADLIFLDFDLCEGIPDEKANTGLCPHTKSTGCLCPTGADLADRIARINYQGQVLVHSANVIGSQTIIEKLNGSGIRCLSVPFTQYSNGVNKLRLKDAIARMGK